MSPDARYEVVALEQHMRDLAQEVFEAQRIDMVNHVVKTIQE